MKKTQITDNFSVSEQIKLDEIKSLAEQGVKILICNRPDGEEPNQVTCTEINAEAMEQGIIFIHIPVPGRDIPEDKLAEFNRALDNSDDKIHAYCRTGTRSSIFWGLSEARNSCVDDVLAKAKEVGVDLSPVTDQIKKVCEKKSK